jgi:hypothetical protein
MIEKVERRLDTLQTYEYSSGGGGGISTGATLPASPSAGDFFLHTPMGRKILMEYDGSQWNPIISYGTTTMYVNGSSGSNTPNGGTGSGASAFATLQYAIDQLPPLLSNNVTIYVSGNVGNVVIQGKGFTGAYSITITGESALTVTETVTDTGSGIQGSGSAAGTVVKSTSYDSSRARKLIKGVSGANAVYRLTNKIKSTDNKTMYIAGCWPADPAANDQFDIYAWGATLGTVSVTNNQIGVIINYCATSTVSVNQSSVLNMTGCSCGALMVQRNSTLYLTTCYSTAANCVICNYAAYFDAGKSILVATNDSAINTYIQYGSNATLRDGTIIQNGLVGIQAAYGAQVVCSNSSSSGYVHIHSCTTGITAATQSSVVGTANNSYKDPDNGDGNTVDESATAGSYGYID